MSTAETQYLFAWAAELGEQDLTLPEPVSFVEGPMRTISTQRPSRFAVLYLKEISFARLNQSNGGWGRYTPEWWAESEERALVALAALREAIFGLEGGDEDRNDQTT